MYNIGQLITTLFLLNYMLNIKYWLSITITYAQIAGIIYFLHTSEFKGDDLVLQILINFLFILVPVCAFYYYDIMDNKMSFFKSK